MDGKFLPQEGLKTMVNRELKAEIVRRYGSQGNFAHLVGCKQERVSEIVRCRRRLSEAAKKEWASWLGGDVKRLFGAADR